MRSGVMVEDDSHRTAEVPLTGLEAQRRHLKYDDNGTEATVPHRTQICSCFPHPTSRFCCTLSATVRYHGTVQCTTVHCSSVQCTGTAPRSICTLNYYLLSLHALNDADDHLATPVEVYRRTFSNPLCCRQHATFTNRYFMIDSSADFY